MDMKWHVIGIVFLVVVAGCSGGSGPDSSTPATPPTESDTSTTTSSPTSTPTSETDTPTPTPSQTPTATPEPTPDNPWENDILIVNLSGRHRKPPIAHEAIQEAVDYWNANMEYSDFNVSLLYEPSADEADIFIRFSDCIGGEMACESPYSTSTTLGLAPILDERQRIEAHAEIQLKYTEEKASLVTTTKHELGHVLGLEHGEEPMPLMAANTLHTKAAPWNRDNLTVYLDYSDKPGIAPEEYDYQIEKALGYYEDGAGGWIDESPTYTMVNSRSEANVVIELHDEESDLNGDDAKVYPIDGNVEDTYYKRVTILIVPWDVDSTGWRVGYYLAYSFENQSTSTLPEPFRDPTYHAIRRNWWADRPDND